MFHTPEWEDASDIILNKLHHFLKITGPEVDEIEPTQRNRYFGNFATALAYDAVEAGILPLAKIFHQLGARPKYSCEGHLHPGSYDIPYVCCWIDPDLAAVLPEKLKVALQLPLNYAWTFETEDSVTSRLACREAGKSGMVLTLRCPAIAPACLQEDPDLKLAPLVREQVDKDVVRIANQLANSGLPLRIEPPPDKTGRTFRIIVLALPVSFGVISAVIAHKVSCLLKGRPA